jgi:hypothetical protein
VSELHEVVARPDVDEPVLVIGLDGWIDAGFAANTAIGHLREVMDTSLVATWDADVLVDHRSRRPAMHLVEGVNTGMTWPAIELRHGRDPDGRDVLLLVGAEPDVRWRAFSADVVALAGELGTRLRRRLRRLPGARCPTPGPAGSAATATSPEIAAQVGPAPLDAGRARRRRSPPSSGPAPTPSCRPPGSGRRCRTTSPPCRTPTPPRPWSRASPPSPACASTPRPCGRRRGCCGCASTASWPTTPSTRPWSPSSRRRWTRAGRRVRLLVRRADVPSGDELAAEVERFLRDVRRGEA